MAAASVPGTVAPVSRVMAVVLVTQSKVVIAVYRSGHAGEAAAPAPYLVTNPQPDMVMHNQDKLIVLGQMLGDMSE